MIVILLYSLRSKFSGKEPATAHATILLNFFDELRRLLPPN